MAKGNSAEENQVSRTSESDPPSVHKQTKRKKDLGQVLTTKTPNISFDPMRKWDQRGEGTSSQSDVLRFHSIFDSCSLPGLILVPSPHPAVLTKTQTMMLSPPLDGTQTVAPPLPYCSPTSKPFVRFSLRHCTIDGTQMHQPQRNDQRKSTAAPRDMTVQLAKPNLLFVRRMRKLHSVSRDLMPPPQLPGNAPVAGKQTGPRCSLASNETRMHSSQELCNFRLVGKQ